MRSVPAKLKSFCRYLVTFGAALTAGVVGANPVVVSGPNYEQYVQNGTCSDSLCLVTFDPVPAGKTLIITQVSCAFRTQDAPNLPTMLISDTGGFANVNLLIPIFTGNSTSGSSIFRKYVTNDQVLHIVQSGKRPRVNLGTFGAVGSAVSASCSIGGQLRAN